MRIRIFVFAMALLAATACDVETRSIPLELTTNLNPLSPDTAVRDYLFQEGHLGEGADGAVLPISELSESFSMEFTGDAPLGVRSSARNIELITAEVGGEELRKHRNDLREVSIDRLAFLVPSNALDVDLGPLDLTGGKVGDTTQDLEDLLTLLDLLTARQADPADAWRDIDLTASQRRTLASLAVQDEFLLGLQTGWVGLLTRETVLDQKSVVVSIHLEARAVVSAP